MGYISRSFCKDPPLQTGWVRARDRSRGHHSDSIRSTQRFNTIILDCISKNGRGTTQENKSRLFRKGAEQIFDWRNSSRVEERRGRVFDRDREVLPERTGQDP